MDKRKKQKPCQHLGCFKFSRQSIDELKQIKRCYHEECHDAAVSQLWLCVQSDCLYVGCGEDDKDHIERHATAKEHPVAMCLENERLWCFECDLETYWIAEDNGAAESHRTPMGNGSGESDLGDMVRVYNGQIGILPSAGTSAAIGPADDGDFPGLVGLKNLGNTCYMNAALQSLSNCEPLTRFMLDCGPSVISGARKSTLSKSYLQLLRELWGPSRIGSAVPSGVHQAIKLVNPAFRGYQQQDAQEFLRCFMDQLDEEMKQPVFSSVTSNEFKDGDATEAVHSMGNSGDTKGDKPSKTYKSVIGDIFDGKILSSVRCYQCDQISSVRESFQDLSLPIPSPDHLQMLHGGNSIAGTASGSQHNVKPGHGASAISMGLVGSSMGGSSSGVAAMLRYFKPSYWFAVLASLVKWAWGEDVTLSDCLAAFFSEDELKGDNMYSCGHCKKLRNSVKSVKVLQLPEVLCIHLKRFRHDTMLSSKIKNYVSFPLVDLDMASYLHKVPDRLSSSTMYDLMAVICHHGSVGGGHYTAYCKNYYTGVWYEFDDNYVTRVTEQTVKTCQAYVLFYGKKRSRKTEKCHSEFAVELGNRESSLLKFFISKRWLLKFHTFSEPGPITNSDFLCVHGGVAPRNATVIEEHAVALPHALWSVLHRAYGGGPAVNQLYRCKICEDAAKALLVRQETERATFVKLTKMRRSSRSTSNERLDVFYAISNSWFKGWEDFATGKTEDPPGPITNQAITITKNGECRLRYNSDFCQLSPEIWEYLYGIYGGGPVLCQNQGAGMSLSSSTSSGAARVSSLPRESGSDASVTSDSATSQYCPDGGEVSTATLQTRPASSTCISQPIDRRGSSSGSAFRSSDEEASIGGAEIQHRDHEAIAVGTHRATPVELDRHTLSDNVQGAPCTADGSYRPTSSEAVSMECEIHRPGCIPLARKESLENDPPDLICTIAAVTSSDADTSKCRIATGGSASPCNTSALDQCVGGAECDDVLGKPSDHVSRSLAPTVAQQSSHSHQD